jgi:putative tryptophan/tyrosine transport system substrate-binding protein
MSAGMKRREFITLVGGAGVAWPVAARGQQSERVRRIAVSVALAETDPEARAMVLAFTQRLTELGWTDGRNIRIDYHWIGGAGEQTRISAAQLVALAPDIVLADGVVATKAFQLETRTIPIVFVRVPDPVGIGIVPSLANPGGNTTGFTHFEYATAGKWMESLKEIAPGVNRVLVLARDLMAPNSPGVKAIAAIETVARALDVKLTTTSAPDAAQIEQAIKTFAAEPNGGLIALPNITTSVYRELIIALVARYRIPAVYPYRHFTVDGGLLAYSVDTLHQFRQAAVYVDRILKGAKPAELPVQQPIKFQLVINLKTAKALGLDVPPTLLARADEVIE